MTGASTTRAIRNGKGHRAYRRDQAALKRRTRDEDLPCGYASPSGWGCGEHIDTSLPHTQSRSFTADHDQAIDNGGHLVGQVLVPMHRGCNSRKSNHVAVPLDQWAAS
jgi:5-methylcytosine-specific restriction endonuclease McrA